MLHLSGGVLQLLAAFPRNQMKINLAGGQKIRFLGGNEIFLDTAVKVHLRLTDLVKLDLPLEILNVVWNVRKGIKPFL